MSSKPHTSEGAFNSGWSVRGFRLWGYSGLTTKVQDLSIPSCSPAMMVCEHGNSYVIVLSSTRELAPRHSHVHTLPRRASKQLCGTFAFSSLGKARVPRKHPSPCISLKMNTWFSKNAMVLDIGSRHTQKWYSLFNRDLRIELFNRDLRIELKKSSREERKPGN